MRPYLSAADIPFRRLLVVLALLAGVAACSQHQQTAPEGQAPAGNAAQDGARRYLAYQHSVEIDTDEGKVVALHDAAIAACRAASADQCTLLESRISSGRDASAVLKFRAKPDGIRKLIAALGRQGAITGQSTSAEDLAGPIEDIARKLRMLGDYRSKLEALRDRSGSDVDALIKVNRELAAVQAELEADAGKQAYMMQRVETEILDVDIRAGRNQSFWRPVRMALSDFGANLSQGVSIAISGVAYLLPWVVLLGVPAWIGRKLWRRRAQRAQRAQ
jgi:hypothetical protein